MQYCAEGFALQCSTFSKILSASNTEAVGIAYKPPHSIACGARMVVDRQTVGWKVRQTDGPTHAHKASTITIAAHACRGLKV